MAVSGFVEKAKDKVSFAKKIPMLLEATSDDEKPTPGYLFQEITKTTFESIGNCHALLDFLVNRLKKQSPHVKYKVILVLKQVSINGQSEFRSGLRRQADGLRAATSFTGPLDALHGDAFNQKVRSSASQLIELLFSVESPDTADSVAASTSLGRKMEGFGSSPLQKPARESLFDSMVNLTNHLPDVSSFLKPKENLKDNLMLDPASRSQSQSTRYEGCNSGPHQPVNNYTSSDVHSFVTSPSSDGLTLKQGSSSESELTADVGEENELSPESRLVDEITAEGGIRPIPSRDALLHFSSRCSMLDVVEVLKLLNGKLEDMSKDVQMKSLHVIEHLLRSDTPDIAPLVLHHCTNLQKTQHFESASLKAKASKVLKMAESSSKRNPVNSKPDNAPASVSNCDLLKLDTLGVTSFDGEKKQDDAQLTANHFGSTSATIFSGLNFQSVMPADSVHSGQRNVQNAAEPLSMFSGLGLANTSQTFGNQLKTTTCGLDVDTKMTESNKTCTLADPFDPLSETKTVDQTPVLNMKSAHLDLNDLRVNDDERGLKLGFPNTQLASEVNLLTTRGTENTGSVLYPSQNAVRMTSAAQGYVFAGQSSSAAFPTQISGGFRGPVPMNTNAVTIQTPFPLRQGFLSGQSSIPLRLSKPAERRDFDFVGKSSKLDAFDFVQDEIKARKR